MCAVLCRLARDWPWVILNLVPHLRPSVPERQEGIRILLLAKKFILHGKGQCKVTMKGHIVL